MGLNARAQRDIQRITSNTNEYEDITLIAPDTTTVTVIGMHEKHHLGVNTEGNIVNSKTAHVAISEQLLVDAGYPVRNSDNEVDLKGHKVKVKDSTGLLCTYVAGSWYPDESLGLIVIILEDFE